MIPCYTCLAQNTPAGRGRQNTAPDHRRTTHCLYSIDRTTTYKHPQAIMQANKSNKLIKYTNSGKRCRNVYKTNLCIATNTQTRESLK